MVIVDAIYSGIMKNIFKLDKSYDIFLSLTWENNHEHGISGHIYEIIDYFYILNKKFKVGIFFGESINNWLEFKKLITQRYNFSDSELKDYKNNTFYYNRPEIITGKNILFVDGALKARFVNNGTILNFKNILSFKCSNHCSHTLFDIPYKISLLSDLRVYSEIIPEENKIALHYIKKILFKKYKQVNKCKSSKTAMLYVTSNCRSITDNLLTNVINRYNFKKYIVITNKPERYSNFNDERVEFIKPGIDKLFENFNTYIYTPIDGKFDCSPRLIAECKYYNKDVIYHDIDNEYLKIDSGLRVRKNDVKNNFKSLFLTDKDEIIEIINETIHR